MEVTPETILAFAAKQAEQAWKEKRSPYLLSSLAPDLEKDGVHYKAILGDQRLKEFLQTAQDKVQLIFHPTQKSRIGLIPPGEHYEFERVSTSSEPKEVPSAAHRASPSGSQRRYIVANFLQLLTELDDDEAAQVQIPTHILTKIMRDK